MNREEKAAVIDEVAERIQGSPAIFAIDYRGISVKQAVELRQQLSEAGARFQVVKNRLTIRAADKAGAEDLKTFLEGPTALAFVEGDAAVAAKALATFRRQTGLLAFKGGVLDGDVLSVEQVESISRLPARDVLQGQFVGVLASPITGLVRGLASMIGGLASQLQQIAEQGLVSGEPPAAEPEPATAEPAAEATASDDPAAEAPDAGDDAPAEGDAPPAEAPDAGDDAPAETATEEAPDETAADATPAEEAPGSPTAEAETAEQEEASGDAPAGDAPDETTDAPSEGETEQEG